VFTLARACGRGGYARSLRVVTRNTHGSARVLPAPAHNLRMRALRVGTVASGVALCVGFGLFRTVLCDSNPAAEVLSGPPFSLPKGKKKGREREHTMEK
jgi:hypothetical protein